MTPEKKAFYEKYKDLAIAQQLRYGIPASITLAQMYLESRGGTSELARKGNNFFGIKCPPGWVSSGKPYGYYNDDHKGEKFCHYRNVEESVRHHSEFLMGSRYASCRACGPTDYEGWAKGLQAAGYATSKNYAAALLQEIGDYNLHEYDLEGERLRKEGRNAGLDAEEGEHRRSSEKEFSSLPLALYRLPLDGDLVLTDHYGRDPTPYRHHRHNGVDFRAVNTAVYSTEAQGKVCKVGSDGVSGNYVIMEYSRDDGSKYRVSYCHLSQVDVKEGDVLRDCQQIGISGSTGNATGPHLHLTVKFAADGQHFETVDPLEYLAEIAARGQLEQGVYAKKDEARSVNLLDIPKKERLDVATAADHYREEQERLLAQHEQEKAEERREEKDGGQTINSRMSLLSLLFGQDLSAAGLGEGLSGGGDLIGNLLGMMITSAMAMAAFTSGQSQDDVPQQSQGEESSADIPAVIDRDQVAMQRARGVPSGYASSLSSSYADGSLTASEQAELRQRQLHMS